MQTSMPQIHVACRDGELDVVRRLIEREGVDPSTKDRVSIYDSSITWHIELDPSSLLIVRAGSDKEGSNSID